MERFSVDLELMLKLTGAAHFKLFPVLIINCFWTSCKIFLSEDSDAKYLCVQEKSNDNTGMSPPTHSEKGVVLNAEQRLS